MKRLFPLFLLLWLACCGGNPGPNPDPDTGLLQFSIVVRADPSKLFVVNASMLVNDVLKATTNANGFAETRLAKGAYTIHLEAQDFVPVTFTIDLTRHLHRDVKMTLIVPPVTPLSTSGPVFLRDGLPWRWRGVTAFKLARLHADGQNIDPFLDAYKGYNVLRIFDYVPWVATPERPLGAGWESPTAQQTLAFLQYVGAKGWYVEIVLLTDDEPGRVQPAINLVRALTAARPPPPNVIFEIGNEPSTNKHIDTSVLRSTLDASGFLYSSGDYDDSPKFFGRFGTAHTPRDSEWPRKAHDLHEYYVGGGPNAPTDPKHPVPWIADEPIRPDAAGQPPVMTKADDFLCYFAASAILGAGATFHSETGKYGRLPDDPEIIAQHLKGVHPHEAEMAEAALRGLTQFPDNAILAGPYERIDEHGATLRTYKVGPHVVRIRPTDGRIFP